MTSSDHLSSPCPCLNYESSFYCYKCVRSILLDKLKLYKRVLHERNLAKENCALQLMRVPSYSSMQRDISKYQDELEHKMGYLSQLRTDCANQTVSLASISLKNAQRETYLDQQRQHWQMLRHQMYQLKSQILYQEKDEDDDSLGDITYSLTTMIQQQVKMVKYHRFQLAIQAFQMYNLEVGQEYSNLSMQDLISMVKQDEEVTVTTKASPATTATNAFTTEKNRFHRLVQEKVPSGIGNIFGLCIPHRGPSDFHGIIPRDVLISSLRAIASLTNLLARCLGIDLPHPVVFRAVNPKFMSASSPSQKEQSFLHDTTTDIVHTVSSYSADIYDPHVRGNQLTLYSDLGQLNPRSLRPTTTSTPLMTEPVLGSKSVHIPSKSNNILDHGKISSSTASLMSLVGSSSNLISRAAHRALDKMKGVHHMDSIPSPLATSHSPLPQPTQTPKNSNSGHEDQYTPLMDRDSIETRIRYSSCAIIYESNIRSGLTTPVKYELKPAQNGNDSQSYTIGLQLLQNDIVALAIKAGVPISMMWPAEAMLLNLHSLFLYCQHQVESLDV